MYINIYRYKYKYIDNIIYNILGDFNKKERKEKNKKNYKKSIAIHL